MLDIKESSTRVLRGWLDRTEEEEERVIFRNVQSVTVCVCVIPEERRVDSSLGRIKPYTMEDCNCTDEKTSEDEIVATNEG